MSSLFVIALATFNACDGSGLEHASLATEPDATDTRADTSPDSSPELPEPEGPVLEASTLDRPVVPASHPRGPLGAGVTDGTGIVVARSALAGRFLYGLGANPDGTLAGIGGGAAGLAPLRAIVELVPDGASGGAFVIRALDADGRAVEGADGLIESYPYMDVDAATVRVDFAAAATPLEIALYGSCRYALETYALVGAPVFADGLMTWPADEVYERTGQCQYVPREARGVHVHYLRHADVGRDFVPRAHDPQAPFGFFLAGTAEAPLLARLPGLAPDEPPRTYTYHLSPSFPEAFVPAAEETFEAWNDALEATIGRRPFVVARAPEGMIAWDPRYHVVLWDASGGAGAVAPFTEDPDTGEIFQSFVVMWFGELERLVDRYETFFEQHPDVADRLAPVTPPAAHAAASPFEAAAMRPSAHRPLDAPARALVPRTFIRRAFDPDHARQAIAKASELGVDLSEQDIGHMIVVDFLLHELGHNLGLRHNFIGSVDLHRHDPAHSASSTMDYVIGMLTPGSYDRDAMRHGYGLTAPERDDYLYCTDETLELEPACIQWDYGHPIRHQLGVLDAYLVAYPADANAGVVDDMLDEGTFDAELTRLRRMVNSVYETWDDDVVATFEEVLGRVDCGDACSGHVRLRSALALYLLYSRHRVTAWWEPGYPDVWLDFPTLNGTQSAMVMSSYFDIVTSPNEPRALRTTIVDKLPTSAVTGSAELLQALAEHFAGRSALSGDDEVVRDAVLAALADL